MKVAIVGAGPAGLITAKYCIDAGFDCDVFEQTGRVGGTWVYSDKTDLDEFGLPVHSSMYQGLRTNLPKELMFFEPFPYPADFKRSYLYQPEVLQYFENFTNHFNIQRHIKFFRYVTLIEHVEDKWLVKALHVTNKTEEGGTYDVVIICNGHYEVPNIPKIPGASKFKGLQLHSHYYRKPERFAGKRVLLIGAGPSGCDISMLISAVSARTFLSYKGQSAAKVSEDVILKLVPKQIHEHSVEFEDGSVEDVDVIIYCTGYLYNYPFLAKNCEIEVINGKWTKPLYKHIVNIEHPSMAFIGVPYAISVIPLFEVQARFFISTLTGQFRLPSKEEMLNDLEKDVADRKAQNIPANHMHKMGDALKQAEYFNDLTNTANIAPVPNVFNRIYDNVKAARNLSLCYSIVNNDAFDVKLCEHLS